MVSHRLETMVHNTTQQHTTATHTLYTSFHLHRAFGMKHPEFVIVTDLPPHKLEINIYGVGILLLVIISFLIQPKKGCLRQCYCEGSNKSIQPSAGDITHSDGIHLSSADIYSSIRCIEKYQPLPLPQDIFSFAHYQILMWWISKHLRFRTRA